MRTLHIQWYTSVVLCICWWSYSVWSTSLNQYHSKCNSNLIQCPWTEISTKSFKIRLPNASQSSVNRLLQLVLPARYDNTLDEDDFELSKGRSLRKRQAEFTHSTTTPATQLIDEYNQMIIQHMFMTAEQMNQFEILCGVNTMLTGDENLKWSLNCHTERNMMYGGIIRTRFNVTMIDFESPARVFENITTLYQDAANPKSIMTRVQQVTNATIRFTRRCRHSTRHLVMMSNFQTAPFGMIKTETLERRLCPQSDRFQDRVVYYALPINVTKSTSQATTRSRSLRRRLTVPIRALYSFGVNTGAIHLPDLLKEFEKRTNHLRKVRKQLQLTFILDPSRYRLNVLRTRKRSKLTRLSIRKLYQMLHESSKGACQRLEINHRLVGRCKSSVCKLRLRTRYTVNDC